MSDSPMYDAIDSIIESQRKPSRFLMFPEGGPMESHVGVPEVTYACAGGSYVLAYSGTHACGYEWVPDSTSGGKGDPKHGDLYLD